MKWQRYVQLERVKQLKNEGRELLGKEIILTEKRDGENVSCWYDESNEFHISSHNLEVASEEIVSRLKATPEFERIKQMLWSEYHDYSTPYIAYGELLKTVSPTRLEPKRKYVHWVLFDLFNSATEKYESYTLVYQKGYQNKIPVVKSVHEFVPTSLDDIRANIAIGLSWCKRHRREGVVGKAYYDQIFFKEKLDVPDRPKLTPVPSNLIQYPEMPQERILRAVQHAYDEVGLENWRDKSKAMPILVKHVNVEAREHNYSPPKNIFQIYLDNQTVTLPTVSE